MVNPARVSSEHTKAINDFYETVGKEASVVLTPEEREAALKRYRQELEQEMVEDKGARYVEAHWDQLGLSWAYIRDFFNPSDEFLEEMDRSRAGIFRDDPDFEDAGQDEPT